jgi:hypothetical protein
MSNVDPDQIEDLSMGTHRQENSKKTTPRVLKTDAVTDDVLEELAERLYLSKSNALRMAIGTFAQLTDDLANGGRIILRSEAGSESEIRLPLPALRPAKK